MKPGDIVHLPLLGAPSLSRDGRVVAFTVTRPDLVTGANRSELWGGRTDEDQSARLADGPAERAVMSPDGRTIAFLRPDEHGRPQLHLLQIDGGRVSRVTEAQFGVAGAVWSPTSDRIAFTSFTVVDAEAADGATVRVTDLIFYSDAVGYTAGLASCIFVLDVSSGEITQFTFDAADDAQLDWSPAGDQLCFLSAKHEERNNRPRNDLFILSLPEGTVMPRTAGGMTIRGPRFGPDGHTVFFTGTEVDDSGFNDGYASFGVWAVDAWADGRARRVSAVDHSISYVSQMLVPYGEHVYTAIDDHGRVPLVRFDADDHRGAPTPVLTGDFQVNGFDVAGDVADPVFACVVADQSSAGDLQIITTTGVRSLTSFGERFRAAVSLRTPTRIEASSPDGHPLEGWVFTPEGDGPHPVILVVKGGPYTQFGYTMSGPGSFEEGRMLCEAGYLVLLGNPRGASGYGQQHVAGVQASLPETTTTDLLSLLEYTLANFPARANRVGVMGGSFGGYMALWLTATTDVFAGAIGERGCYALDSYIASADDGVNIVHALWGADRERWQEQSPVAHVDGVDAPVLLLHSDQDRHAPIEQARRMFTELKLRDKSVELVIFPGGNHELSRTGPVRQRLARFRVILEWWQRVLVD